MKRFLVRLAAGLLVLVLFGSALLADCATRRRVVVQTPVVVDNVIATPAIVATTFVPVTVPAYSVTYAPGADTAEVQKLREELKQLKDVIAKAQEHGLLKGDKAAEKSATPSVQERAVSLVQAKCGSCHSGAQAKKGFAIFQDGKLNVTPKLLGAVYRGTTADGKKMPPSGAAWTDEEVAVIQDGLGR